MDGVATRAPRLCSGLRYAVVRGQEAPLPIPYIGEDDPHAIGRVRSSAAVRAAGLRRGGSIQARQAAVVGSMSFFTSVILVAGKPLISASLRMTVSPVAR